MRKHPRMAGPVLMVELPSADTTRPEAAALVQACTEGLGGGRCELSSGSAESAAGVAVVSLRGSEALGALIEVGSRRGESRSWHAQEITFQPQDARVERFRTLGLAIATLYRETQLDIPAQDSPARDRKRAALDAQDKKSASSAAPPAENGRAVANDDADARGLRDSRQGSGVYPRGWLSAGALTAYDHELPRAFRFGGQLALGMAPLELPLLVNFTGSYAVGRLPESSGSPELLLTWATLGLGAGGYLSLGADFQLRVSLQGVLVDLEAHGSDPQLGSQESQRWLLGGQAGLELVARASRRWGLALGTQVQQLRGATSILVYDRPVATVAALSVQLYVSLEFRPFQR